MKVSFSVAFLLATVTSAFAAPVPEVSASGSLAAIALTAGAMAWFLERRKNR
jgi:hypothetical protein